MKIHGKPCNTTECTLTIVIIYLSVIIPSFFGFEGSRRATANATCAKFCYHFQVRLGLEMLKIGFKRKPPGQIRPLAEGHSVLSKLDLTND